MTLKLPAMGVDEDGNHALASGIKFTQEEMEWITAKPKPNEKAYINNCVVEFLERELAKNKARLRWLGAQEGEVIK